MCIGTLNNIMLTDCAIAVQLIIFKHFFDHYKSHKNYIHKQRCEF